MDKITLDDLKEFIFATGALNNCLLSFYKDHIYNLKEMSSPFSNDIIEDFIYFSEYLCNRISYAQSIGVVNNEKH